MYVEGRRSHFPGSPVIYNDLLSFSGIQDQVVIWTPYGQMLNLFIIVSSFPDVKPTKVVSPANFTIELEE